jgi:hypothetical protein
MLASPLRPTASGSSSWRRREALLDENLSDRIISRIADLFPGSTHIEAVSLREADDFVVWDEGVCSFSTIFNCTK